MGLGIPGIEIQNIIVTVRIGPVRARIRPGIWPKQISITPAAMKAERVVQGMARLVTHYAHALAVGAALNLQHLIPLKPHQPGMSQVKWYRESGYSIGSEPLL